MNEEAVKLAKSGKWIGFGLDKTLAKFDGEPGCEVIDQIGEPIKSSVEIIKKAHADGYIVKIMTARVAPTLCGETHAAGCTCGHCEDEAAKEPVMQEPYLCELGQDGKSFKKTATMFIHEWCDKHLGFRPEVVCSIDRNLAGFYSWRVTETMNDGEPMRNAMKRLMDNNQYLENHFHRNEKKRERGFMKFMLGMFLATGIYIGSDLWYESKRIDRHQAEVKLCEAIHDYIHSKDPEISVKCWVTKPEFRPSEGLNCTGCVSRISNGCKDCEKKRPAISCSRVRPGRRPVEEK